MIPGLEDSSRSVQALARRYRPSRFAEVIGQGHAVQVLAKALAANRLHHAYLFTGTRGVGKTTLARILAKALNCMSSDKSVAEPCDQCSSCTDIAAGSSPDVFELDAASHTQVDSLRELIDTAQYVPASSRFKVYIIDEVHMLSKHAFNAMLKTLEEPPDHAKFILATTDPQMVPPTVLSRCLRFSLRRLDAELISEQLSKICAQESLAAQDAALDVIARAADGSMRDALSILDEAAALDPPIQAEAVREMIGLMHTGMTMEIVRAIHAGDGQALRSVCDRMHAQGSAFDAALSEIGSFLRDASFSKISGTSSDDDVRAAAEMFSDSVLQVMYEIALHARQTLQWAPDYRNGFEMALLRMLVFANQASKRQAADVKPVVQPAAQSPAEAKPAKPAVGEMPTTAKMWNDLATSLSSSAGALARKCTFVSASGNRLELALTDESNDTIKRAEKFLFPVLKKHFPEIEIAFGQADPSSNVQTPQQQVAEQAQMKKNEALRAIEQTAEFSEIQEAFPSARIENAKPAASKKSS